LKKLKYSSIISGKEEKFCELSAQKRFRVLQAARKYLSKIHLLFEKK